jgi:hypothetical protein
LNRVVRKKNSVMIVEKPKIKKPCNHSSYGLGVLYNADPEVNPGWCAPGKFLFGVKCAGCGSPFVQKAPPKGGGKKPGEPQVPSTTNPVCCCNNLRNQNGALEEGCSHANCKCFVGMTPFSRHQRVMGQGRPGEAFSPTPSLWSCLHEHVAFVQKIGFSLHHCRLQHNLWITTSVLRGWAFKTAS